MGWWGKARYSCPKGKERIAAVIEDEEKNCESEKFKWEVIDSAVKGTTVYLATRRTNKETGENIVYGEVCLTRWNPRGYFMIKCMSEDMGPYYYDAPKHLLDKLTAPYNESAKEWREKCAEHRVKNRHTELNKLPMGAKIRLKNYWKEGEWILTVDIYKRRRSYIDWNHCLRFPAKIIESCGWETIFDPSKLHENE